MASGIGDERKPLSFGVAVLLVVCTVVTVVAALGLGLNRLRSSEEQSHLALVATAGIESRANRIEALEWEGIATGGSATVRREYERARRELLAQLDASDGSTRRLLSDTTAYLEAIDREFDALASGDRKLAVNIDEREVDPRAEDLMAQIDDLSVYHRAKAESTSRATSLLTTIILALTAVVFGLFWIISLRQRDRRRTVQLTELHSARTKSVIETSSDLFTVVSREDELTVLSSDLRSLAPFVGQAEVDTVRRLLPDVAYAGWRKADAMLRLEGGHQQIDITLDGPVPGSSTHLEAHGASLAADHSERVWVWRDVTARKTLELQLAHDALHDALTGVANRSLLVDRATHALSMSQRLDRPVSLLFGDLDGFKSVNDSLGHQHGDDLLKIVTQRIASCLRPGDTLARFGGDEFAVLLEDTDSAGAQLLAGQLLTAVGQQVDLGDRMFFPSISFGIATAGRRTSSEDLLRNADLAMYAAKRSGRGRAEVYHDDMHEAVDTAFALAADLKRALANGEFTLHYQPTVDLQAGTVEGVEALIRWTHPTRGSIRPDEFIPVAESNGMIVPIGKWVLEEACRTAAALQTADAPPYLMAVNLSPQQLRDPAIVQTVQAALQQAHLSPELLVLEVTEGSLLADTIAVNRLHDLRAIGVHIAVDDFGTGYTSINYLQNLPISILKIDRSFISGGALAAEERRAFLSAIVGLAQSLNLRSVAEGIEREEEFAELKHLGCTTGQGFLWSAACSGAEIVERIGQLERTISPSQNASGSDRS